MMTLAVSPVCKLEVVPRPELKRQEGGGSIKIPRRFHVSFGSVAEIIAHKCRAAACGHTPVPPQAVVKIKNLNICFFDSGRSILLKRFDFEGSKRPIPLKNSLQKPPLLSRFVRCELLDPA